MEDDLKERILAYMRGHNAMTLSTYGEGTVWAASVFYANDGFALYFVTDPKTRHGRNIMENPLIAATINEDYGDWRKIKGIQLEGRAEMVSSRGEKVKALATYLRKFPSVADFFTSPSKLSITMFTQVTSTTFFKISPSRILLLDNERGFSHREELLLV